MCSVAPPKCLICDDFFDRKPILLAFGDGEMEPTMAEILTTYREGFKVFWNLSKDDKEAKENEIDILSEFAAASGVMDHPCCEPCFEKLKELQSCQEIITEKRELQKELVKGMMEDFQHVKCKAAIIAKGKWRMANSSTVDKWDSLRKKINKHIGLDPETLDSAEENDAKPVVRPPDDNEKEKTVKVKREVVDKKSSHLKTGTQTRTRATHTLSAINKNTKGAKKKPDNKNTKDSKKKPDNKNTKDAKKKPDIAKAIITKKSQPLKKRQRLENPKTGTVSMSLKERLERVDQGEVCYCDGCGKGIQNAQFFMCTSCLTMKEDGSIGFDLCLQCYATRRVHVHTHHKFKRVFHYCKI